MKYKKLLLTVCILIIVITIILICYNYNTKKDFDKFNNSSEDKTTAECIIKSGSIDETDIDIAQELQLKDYEVLYSFNVVEYFGQEVSDCYIDIIYSETGEYPDRYCVKPDGDSQEVLYWYNSSGNLQEYVIDYW